MEPIGLEPTTSCMPCESHTTENQLDDTKNKALAGSVTENARSDCVNPSIPADLQQLIDAWPQLPEPVKTGIMAMVRASEGESELSL